MWETFCDVDGTFFLIDKKSKELTGCKLCIGFYPSITAIFDDINQQTVPHYVKFGYDSIKNKTYIQTRHDIILWKTLNNSGLKYEGCF